MAPRKSKRPFISLTILATLLAVGAFAALVKPGPVYWVDLYWTVMLDSGRVDPSRDRYPWTVAVDWSPDGDTVLSSGYHQEALLWDSHTGRLKRRLVGHKSWIQEAIFSPDGARIATADWDGLVMVWRSSDGRLEHKMKTDSDLFTVSFHPDNVRLAAGSYTGSVTVFSLESGEVLSRFQANQGGVMNLAYSPDGKLLATAGEDAQIHLYDSSTLTLQGKLSGHGAGITSLSFYQAANQLLSCGDDGTVRLWDLKARRQLRVWDTGTRWVNFCTFLPSGEGFLTADTSGAVRRYRVNSEGPGEVVTRHDDWAQCVRTTRDGARFSSCGKAGYIKIWDLRSESLARTIDVSQAM